MQTGGQVSIKGWTYRKLMVLAHRFDWHHAPVFGPFEDGRYQRWCQWCGFRETFGVVKPLLTVNGVSTGSKQVAYGEKDGAA
jgi:hypothetical protein